MTPVSSWFMDHPYTNALLKTLMIYCQHGLRCLARKLRFKKHLERSNFCSCGSQTFNLALYSLTGSQALQHICSCANCLREATMRHCRILYLPERSSNQNMKYTDNLIGLTKTPQSPWSNVITLQPMNQTIERQQAVWNIC